MENFAKEQFFNTYQKSILPIFADLDCVRKAELVRLIIKEVGLLFVFLISVFISYRLIISGLNVFTGQGTDVFWGTVTIVLSFFIAPAIVIIIPCGMYSLIKNKSIEFKTLIKKKCIKAFSETFSLKWLSNKPKESLPLQISDIFPAYSDIEYDDCFEGEYNNVKFNIQELKLILKSSKDKSTKFKGIAICIPSNKSVKACTIVTTKGDVNIRNRVLPVYAVFIISLILIVLGILALKTVTSAAIFDFKAVKAVICSFLTTFSGVVMFIFGIFQIKNENRLRKVELEDLKFDKRFNVYSENQIEARYLITPSFMNRLYNFQTAFGTKNIKCSFFDDKVMFAISTNKDLFELGNLFVSLRNNKQIESFYNEIVSIYNIIDYFKFDEKTGL